MRIKKKYSNGGCMKTGIKLVAFIIIVIWLFSVWGCSKQKDYSYLNTDRREKIVLVSQRFTNPPRVDERGFWIANKIVEHDLHPGTDPTAYRNLPADTIPKDWKGAWCVIQGEKDLVIEIRTFSIK